MVTSSSIVPVLLFEEPEAGQFHVPHKAQIPWENEATTKGQDASGASQVQESCSLKEILAGGGSRAAGAVEVIYNPMGATQVWIQRLPSIPLSLCCFSPKHELSLFPYFPSLHVTNCSLVQWDFNEV